MDALSKIEMNIEGMLKLPLFLGLEIFQISINRQKLFLWLEGEVEELDNKMDMLKVLVMNLTKTLGIEVAVFEHTPGLDKRITNMNCLSTIRKNAPIKMEELIEIYQQKKFPDINEDTVSNVTDRLRKAKLLVRAKDGSFFLTSKAFDHLGSGLGADSPDVIRLLALASGKV